jgi:hypothetical protein
MPLTAERQLEHIGATRAISDRGHDLIQVFSERIDCLWRYDQYIANAEGNAELQNLWRDLKDQDRKCIDRMKEFLAVELKSEER